MNNMAQIVEQQKRENTKLQELVEKQADELNQIPETWRTVVQMNNLWQKNCKFEALNRLLSITESSALISDVDPALLNQSKQLMDQVEELRRQHAKLNDEIVESKKSTEQEALLSKRAKNLNDLLSKLDQVLTVCDRKRDILVDKNSHLDNWITALSFGADQLSDNDEYTFVNIQNEQFNNLMQQKKNYESACEVLQQRSELYLDCLKNSEQLLNELRTRHTVEEKNKEKDEIEKQLNNLTVVQTLYRNLQD